MKGYRLIDRPIDRPVCHLCRADVENEQVLLWTVYTGEEFFTDQGGDCGAVLRTCCCLGGLARLGVGGTHGKVSPGETEL